MREPFELSLHGESAPHRVAFYRATEGLSRLYRFEVRVVRKDAAQLAASAAGKAVTLALFGEDTAVRHVQGIVTGTQLEGHGSYGSGITLVLEPRLARLRWRRRRRIFQDVTGVDVVTTLFAEHAVPLRTEVRRKLSVRPYCVQLDESDLDFSLRLLSEEGIFYFFEQPPVLAQGMGEAPAETVVLADRAESYPRAQPFDKLRHRGAKQEAVPDGIYDPRLSRSVAGESVALRGLDFHRPAIPFDDGAEVPRSATSTMVAPFERKTHELSYETVPPAPGPAAMELEQERRDVVRLEAETHVRHLAPGSVFSLVESLEPELCGDYVVTEISHQGRGAARDETGPKWVFEAAFAAVPSTTPYRPERLPKPLCRGVETATVVGPHGEEIHADHHGRIRVRFPWDDGAIPDDVATTWLRVAQGWAGTGFGMQFIPRVGSEVLVAFVGGDPDRPIVVGGLYDAVRPYPQVLPQKKTVSSITTATVGGAGGNNEISFEDAAGGEVLSIRGQRNLWLGSGADHFVQAGGSQSISVGASSSTAIGTDEKVTVGGNRSASITGTSTEESATASITRHGNEIHVIDDCEFKKVLGASETRVGGGYQLSVGTEGTAFANITVQGTCSLRSYQRMTIGSEQDISLVVGESSILIAPNKIVMKTPELLVSASSIKLHGEDGKEYVEIGDGIRVKSETVTANGGASTLSLAGEAKLSGPSVQLTGPGKPLGEVSDDSSDESGTVTFRIKNVDPSKRTTALVLKPSGQVEELAVPSSGVLQIPGKPGEKFSLVDVRVDGASVAKTRA